MGQILVAFSEYLNFNFRDTHPDIEMIFLTGDFPAHDVWRQDRKHNKASSKAIVDSVTR